jgi:hypothetical protein
MKINKNDILSYIHGNKNAIDYVTYNLYVYLTEKT